MNGTSYLLREGTRKQLIQLSTFLQRHWVVSRGQTANFFTGRYRLQYKRPRALILQAITPCKKISGLATRD